MPKVINVKKKPELLEDANKPKKSTGQTIVFGVHVPDIRKKQPEPPTSSRVQTFISRFANILLYDIMQKFSRVAPGVTKPHIQKFEDFHSFCNLARGKR